jgi:hypothetical protein
MEIIIKFVLELISGAIFEGLLKGIRIMNSFLRRTVKRAFIGLGLFLIILIFHIGCNPSNRSSDNITAENTLNRMQANVDSAVILYESAIMDYHAGKPKSAIIEKYKSQITQLEINAKNYFTHAKNHALEGDMSHEEFYSIINKLQTDSLQHKVNLLLHMGIRLTE